MQTVDRDGVQFDMCPSCRGVWLDRGELEKLMAAAQAPVAAPGSAVPAGDTAAEGAKLRQIFADSDEARLRRNPVEAIFRGDLRYADRLGDFLTTEYEKAERQALLDDLKALGRVDRDRLSAVDRIAYDVFKADRERDLSA
jgi:Zn-finger nucleic acid-binding protein